MDELKKILMAGIGAVQTGLEKGQELVDELAQKGEPIFNQAKQSVRDAAGKVKTSYEDSVVSELISGKFKKETIAGFARQLSKEDLFWLKGAVDGLIASAEEEEKAAQDEEECGCCDCCDCCDEEEQDDGESQE